MALGQRLELKHSQQLAMTPQLQQSIRLLQMSSLDAQAFVAEEVEKNPILRADDDGGEAQAPTEARREAVDREIGRADPAAGSAQFDTGAENLTGEGDRMSAAGEPSYSWAGVGAGGGSGGGFAEAIEGFEESLSATETLRDALLPQVAMAEGSSTACKLAALLIDDLDDDGYLRTDLSALADRLGANRALVEEALAILQSCEPTGVGARDLGECLALQLKERDRFDPAMSCLIEHLDELAAARFDRLIALCGVEEDDLQEMVEEIRALNPRPGALYSGGVMQTVVADVFIRRNDQGGWSVEVNSDAMPKVLLDKRYAAELTASGEVAAKSFVAECRQNADWLIKALDQRAQTILKVGSEIARRQGAFFSHGVSKLTPMTLRDVADEISMHESTVSRVTANKYISCERGLFPMKFFFTTAIAGADGGEAVSAEAVRMQIKALIEKEESRKPLSDDKIVALLKASGVDIARRTVAKYREAMNIPSSSRRKRIKAVALDV